MAEPSERDRDALTQIVKSLHLESRPRSYWIKARSVLAAYRESCVAEERMNTLHMEAKYLDERQTHQSEGARFMKARDTYAMELHHTEALLAESEAARLKAEGERDQFQRVSLFNKTEAEKHHARAEAAEARLREVEQERDEAKRIIADSHEMIEQLGGAPGDAAVLLPLPTRIHNAISEGMDDLAKLEGDLEAAEARLRAVIEAADRLLTTLEPRFTPGDERQRDAIVAYRRIRDAQPPASHEPHVFHNRLDEQQRKEGEQEPCALCGRMLDAAIHASPEPEASPRVHEFAGPDIHHDFQHNHSPTVSIREKCLVCGFTPQAHLCWSCGLPWSQHGEADRGK